MCVLNEVKGMELNMEKVNAKDYLGKEVSIEIDRPLGTRHPKRGFNK